MFERQRKYTIFQITLFLLILEFVNTYLRGFAIIDMRIGILLRQVIFFFNFILLCYCVFAPKGNSIRIEKNNISYILLYLFYALIYLFCNTLNITDIANIVMPFIIGVLAAKSGYIGYSKLNKFAVAFFIVFASAMYLYYVVKGSYHNETGGINLIYFIVALLPIILQDSNKLYRYSLTCLVVLVTVLSLKTTAMLSVIAVIFLEYLFRTKNKSVRIVFLPFVLLVTILCGIYVASEFLSLNLYDIFIKTNIADGGNGRIAIWGKVIAEYIDGNLLQIIFGRGYNATAVCLGISAHNDFLEILFDYGMLGCAMFIFCLLKMALLIPKMIKTNYQNTLLYSELIAEVFIYFIFSNAIFQASYILIIMLYLFAIRTNFLKRAKSVKQ